MKRVRRNDDCKIIVGRLFWETQANRPKCRTVILASYFISLAKRSYEDRKGVSQSCLCDILITKKLFLDTMQAIRKQNDLMFNLVLEK